MIVKIFIFSHSFDTFSMYILTQAYNIDIDAFFALFHMSEQRSKQTNEHMFHVGVKCIEADFVFLNNSTVLLRYRNQKPVLRTS